MPIRVIVNGAQGKMGTLASYTIQQHPDLELVGQLSRHDNLSATIANTRAEVVVDLTRADCAYDNCLTIINSGAHPVIGTSGLLPQQITELTRLCEQKQSGGIIAPNFSIGAVLMMKFAKEAARFMPDVEIIESHHQHKYDAPSGTAAKTAELIAAARLSIPANQPEHEQLQGARGGVHEGIHIHSVRLPGFVAKQEVVFGATGETLSLCHNSIDRASFMPGIVLCCQKAVSLRTLYYGMEHILDL